jgi:hypothetical protein
MSPARGGVGAALWGRVLNAIAAPGAALCTTGESRRRSPHSRQPTRPPCVGMHEANCPRAQSGAWRCRGRQGWSPSRRDGCDSRGRARRPRLLRGSWRPRQARQDANSPSGVGAPDGTANGLSWRGCARDGARKPVFRRRGQSEDLGRQATDPQLRRPTCGAVLPDTRGRPHESPVRGATLAGDLL